VKKGLKRMWKEWKRELLADQTLIGKNYEGMDVKVDSIGFRLEDYNSWDIL
jgi:hypothetical protein